MSKRISLVDIIKQITTMMSYRKYKEFYHITSIESGPHITPFGTESHAISTPAGYEQIDVRLATQNGIAVRITRYERTDGHNRGRGGEHFTTVRDVQTDQLKGVTWMEASFANMPLPSRDEAQCIAETLLARVAPDLVGTLTV